jgi:hypothetical protein
MRRDNCSIDNSMIHCEKTSREIRQEAVGRASGIKRFTIYNIYIYIYTYDMKFYYVAQAHLKLLGSSYPASVSQAAGTTGVWDSTWD